MLEVVRSFGVTTTRFVSGFLAKGDGHFSLMGCLGSSFVEWNLTTKEEKRQLHAHDDMIVCMLKHKERPHFLTCSFSGQVAIWDFGWKRLSNVLQIPEKVGFASWTDDCILISTNDEHTFVIVSIKTQSDSEYPFLLSLDSIKEIFVPFACVNHSNNYFLINQMATDKFSLSIRNRSFELLQPQIIDTEQANPVYHGELDTFSHLGHYVVVGTRDRMIYLINCDTLEILDCIQAPGHGVIRQLRLTKDRVVCPSEGGNFHEFKIEGEKLIQVKTFKGPSGSIHFFDWIDEENGICCAYNDYQIWVFNSNDVAAGPLVSFHEITCCGVDLTQVDANDFEVAAGDFSGKIVSWKANENKPVRNVAIAFPIRSLKWLPNGTALIIGDLEGYVHLWTPLMDIQSFWKLEGGVASIDIYDDTENNAVRLAFGCTSGFVSVMELSKDRIFEDFAVQPRKSWVGHKAIENSEDLNFGSIKYFAEVWSLAWSPDGEFLVTGSEDQSAAIWKVGDWFKREQGHSINDLTLVPDPIKMAVLKKHSLAITCVKWKRISTGEEIIATSSDDRTVCIWNPQTLELRFTVSTTENKFDIGWHTITYCDIEQNGSRIIAGTSNGYIFCWNLFPPVAPAPILLFGRKMHAGSIEGLCWNLIRRSDGTISNNLIASCSSDCSIHKCRLKGQ